MPLQNHIHLSTAIGDTPEHAPTLKWVTRDRLDIPTVFIAKRRGLSGRLRKHVLHNETGPIRLTNFKYTVKVQADFGYTLEQRIAQLKAMNGASVFLVDHFHASDGTDHTQDIRPMFCTIGELPPIGPGLQFFFVDIDLEDDSL